MYGLLFRGRRGLIDMPRPLSTTIRLLFPKTLTPDETAGLKLFIGKAKCTNCHNGPLFTNGDFHNTGVPTPPKMPPDLGRADGIRKVLLDEFNCLGKYSDAGSGDCAELRYMDTDTTKYSGAFKTPYIEKCRREGSLYACRPILDSEGGT